MMTNKEKSSATFLLRLTPEERKKLKLKSVQMGTTMQSLLKHLLFQNKKIEDL